MSENSGVMILAEVVDGNDAQPAKEDSKERVGSHVQFTTFRRGRLTDMPLGETDDDRKSFVCRERLG